MVYLSHASVQPEACCGNGGGEQLKVWYMAVSVIQKNVDSPTSSICSIYQDIAWLQKCSSAFGDVCACWSNSQLTLPAVTWPGGRDSLFPERTPDSCYIIFQTPAGLFHWVIVKHRYNPLRCYLIVDVWLISVFHLFLCESVCLRLRLSFITG